MEPAAKQYGVVIIGGEGDPLAAASTFLVLALLALNVPADPRCPFVETVELVGEDAERSHRWILRDQSTCRAHHTAALRRDWNAGPWLAAHPTHPLSQIRAAFHSRGLHSIPPALLAQLPPGWLTQAAPASPAKGVSDAFTLHPLLLAELEKSVPLLVIRKGSRRVLIPIDATPEEEAALLAKLSK
jgi:hypothetical protein